MVFQGFCQTCHSKSATASSGKGSSWGSPTPVWMPPWERRHGNLLTILRANAISFKCTRKKRIKVEWVLLRFMAGDSELRGDEQ